VGDSDNTLFTRYSFFVLFGGDEVGEALVGVFLISIFFSPLDLLISFLGWWHPLNALSCSQCFLVVVMRLSTLGLVGGYLFFLVLGLWLPPPSSSSSCTR
jgi:hypothetical protein